MKSVNLTLISQDDVMSIVYGNVDSFISIVEASFLKYANGEIILPGKISQVFDINTQNRINCMPATIKSDDNVSGVKWISVFPSNAKYGLQNITGVTILSEINSGFPLAIIDASFSTKIRTAAIGCIAAKYLAPSKVEKIGIIGSGEEARMHFALLKHIFPSITECRVASRKKESEMAFIDNFQCITPNVEFIACNGDTHKSALNADIIITAISSQCPVLHADDINKGCLYIHVGGWEDDYGVALKANKIVCDDWESAKHRSQTLVKMYNEGLISDNDIYANLSDLIVGACPGRQSDDEFIYFSSVGLAFTDIAIAHYIYKESFSRGLGKGFELASTNPTNYQLLI